MGDCFTNSYVFIIGYVDQMCQSFHSGCVFSLFSTMVVDPIIVDFGDLSFVEVTLEIFYSIKH